MKVSSIGNEKIMEENFPFKISALDRTDQFPFEIPFQNHIQKNYEIVWVQVGSGNHILNNTNFPIGDNRIYCALPGQQHQLNINAGSKGYVISFTESFLNSHYNEYSPLYEENFFHRLLQRQELNVPAEFAEDLQEIIMLLLKEIKNNFLLRTEIVTKYLKIFLLYIGRLLAIEQQSPIISKNNSLQKHFLWLIENNFKEKKSVSQYARELSVSPNHLNKVLKVTTGFSARHHIQQRIILEAKRKAHNSNNSMKEIAYDLGFDDLAHFSKFFKNMSGINFTDFKNGRVNSIVKI